MIEYLSANLWQVWAVIAILGLVLELTSGDFFIICFAIGAVGAAIVSPFAGFYVQLAVFAIVTALSIFQVRPFALRYLHKRDSNRLSNADAVVGQRGHVSERIPAGGGYGRVALPGDDWRALSADGQELPVGTPVQVVARESIVITVEKIDD